MLDKITISNEIHSSLRGMRNALLMGASGVAEGLLPPEFRTHKEILSDGAMISYLNVKPESAKGSRPNLVFTTGAGNGVSHWFPGLILPLAKVTGCEIYVVETPLRGASTPPNKIVPGSQLSDITAQLIGQFFDEKMPDEKIVIGGQSWGALPAAKLLKREQVIGGILISPILRGMAGLGALLARVPEWQKGEASAEVIAAMKRTPTGLTQGQETFETLLGALSLASVQQVREVVNPATRANLDVGKPVLIVQGGAFDKVTLQGDPLAGEDVQPMPRLPNIEGHIIQDASHALFRTHREELAGIFGGFIDRL